MSEEYDEVYDFKKIGIVIGVIGIVAIIVIFFAGLFTETLSEFMPVIELPVLPELTDLDIKPNYRKFLDFGISADDIKDIQNMDCISFENEALISKDPKYTMIFEERRSEC